MKRCVLVLLVAWSACGDSTVKVPSRLTLDVSCQTEDPNRVAMTCSAELGVWIYDEADDTVLHSACEPLDAPATLSSLPDALDSIDLSGIEADVIRVELAVLSPATGECRVPSPNMVVHGESVVDLANRAPLLLELQCILDPDQDAFCSDECADDYEDCQWDLSSDRVNQCQELYESCVLECDGDGTECECRMQLSTCLETEVSGQCSDLATGCVDICSIEQPEESCLDCLEDYQDCRQLECQSQREQCLSACTGGSECLSING